MAKESIAGTVASRLKRRPGHLFTFEDFADLSASAVAPALSRLASRGEIKRARKGVYYVPRETPLGEVPPDPVALGKAISRGRSHPAGLTAANMLGLTTQVPTRVELAVEDARLTAPRGVEFRPRLRTNRRGLEPHQAALLEVLRDIRHVTDLSPLETGRRLLEVLYDDEARSRILRAAIAEPPRVRAMVGALAEIAGAREKELERLRRTLNPTTRFDFGPLGTLRNARSWGAR